jgi:4-hydroxy-tetrahydrodipicolinate reductase
MKQKIRVAVVGANGKMGSVVCETLNDDFEIIKIGRKDDLNNFNNLGLVIDFASAISSVNSAKFAVQRKIPLIVGSTGQTEEERNYILSAGQDIAVMMCANFSVGISKINELISDILKLKMSEIAIFEKHHSVKKDKPSGTALDLKRRIEKQSKVKIDVLSERGGQEIGTHKIDFYFGSELISIEHKAFSRKAFADGVLLATKFMTQNASKGVVDFNDVVKNYYDESN